MTVRSKDKGGRLVAWTAAVTVLEPHSEEWEAAVGELKGKRLNAPDAEQADGALGARVPGRAADARRASSTDLPDASLAAPPLPTGATTRRRRPPRSPGCC